MFDFVGGRTRARTWDPLIKSQLFRAIERGWARFSHGLARVHTVDGPHPKGTQPKIVKFTCTPKSSHFVQNWYPSDEPQKLHRLLQNLEAPKLIYGSFDMRSPRQILEAFVKRPKHV